MPRPIEAVLYDFGGVFTLSPFSVVAEGGPALVEVLFGPYGEDTDHPWHRLERGEVSLSDARVTLLKLAVARGIEEDPFSVLAALGREDPQRAAVVERARAIKRAGLKTALVTNNVVEFGDGWRAMVPVDELFDVVVDSCRSGFRKPNPAMFHAALDAVGVPADRAVFLDDYPPNVAAAEAIGLLGILVGEDRLAAFDQLDAALNRG